MMASAALCQLVGRIAGVSVVADPSQLRLYHSFQWTKLFLTTTRTCLIPRFSAPHPFGPPHLGLTPLLHRFLSPFLAVDYSSPVVWLCCTGL